MRACERVVVVMMAALLMSALAVAQEAPAEPAPAKMSDEQQAMMESWMKAGTPGEQHQWLAKMAGSWNLEVHSWMDPAGPPAVSTGSATMRMVMDGRYLEERIDGSMMEMPFSGLGYTGYDNVLDRYVSVWMDSMSTGIMRSEGTYDEASHTLTMSGEYVDPVSGETKTMRGTTRYDGSDRAVFTYFDTAPDGSQYKSMEIVYTRR